METQFDLSIIIPCHFSGRVISPLLYSLRKQQNYGYKIELLFIKDDEDGDNTTELIATYLTGKPFTTQVIKLQPCLQAQARNYGMDIAQGKYIMFIDSDDWLIDDMALMKLLTYAKAKDTMILKFGYDYPPSFQFEHCNAVVWQYVYNKEFLERHGVRFPKQRYDEDVGFLQELFKKYVEETGQSQLPCLSEKYYYYNYGRFDSVMTNRLAAIKKAKEEEGEG